MVLHSEGSPPEPKWGESPIPARARTVRRKPYLSAILEGRSLSGMTAGNAEVERFLADLAHDLRNLLEGLDIALFRDPGAASDPEVRNMTHRELRPNPQDREHLDRARLRDSRVELRPSSVELDAVCRLPSTSSRPSSGHGASFSMGGKRPRSPRAIRRA